MREMFLGEDKTLCFNLDTNILWKWLIQIRHAVWLCTQAGSAPWLSAIDLRSSLIPWRPVSTTFDLMLLNIPKCVWNHGHNLNYLVGICGICRCRLRAAARCGGDNRDDFRWCRWWSGVRTVSSLCWDYCREPGTRRTQPGRRPGAATAGPCAQTTKMMSFPTFLICSAICNTVPL